MNDDDPFDWDYDHQIERLEQEWNRERDAKLNGCMAAAVLAIFAIWVVIIIIMLT